MKNVSEVFTYGSLTTQQVESLRLLADNGIYKEDFEILKENYNIVTLNDVKVHRLVFELTPPMNGEEFNDLIEDIAQNGQIEPIKIWKKAGSLFVVDGRNRINALEVLGVNYVKYVEVNVSSLEDLEIKIRSWDKRRKTSKSQKAVVAYLDWLKNAKVDNHNMSFYAKKHGVSKAFISYCKTIDEIRGGGRYLLDEMFKTRYITVGSKRYASLNAAIDALKKLNEDQSEQNHIDVPESAKEIIRQLHLLKDNDDLISLSYIIKDAQKLISQLANKES